MENAGSKKFEIFNVASSNASPNVTKVGGFTNNSPLKKTLDKEISQPDFDPSPKRQMNKMMNESPFKRLSKIPEAVSHPVLPQVGPKTTKHNESIIDSLNEQFFGAQYELDEKAKKYRNIIKDKIKKSKYLQRGANPFANTSTKLSLPNIGDRGDLDWNALTQVDFSAAIGNEEMQREFTADTHKLMGNILEPNDIGYGEDHEEETLE